ncbi:hypothetical protein TWF481_004933 [Arthrobotrys musiformis]|uniref:Uncharacterized protein n=1 Tax=Arthrobotrys musiformis TaxID=47236 RepID=A0AAV9WML3_9PEZI
MRPEPVTDKISWVLSLFFLFADTVCSFYLEAAVDNGEYFSRPYPLKSGNGKPEVQGLYQCITGSDLVRDHPLEGVAVWNRPGSQPTLAVALYAGSACTRTRVGGKSLPLIMMLLDPNRIRGVHVVNLKAYGLSPECKSWQGVKVQDEMKPGGALHGYDRPQLLPGSLVYWDSEGMRRVGVNAVKWVNAIPYEPLTTKRQISQYIRELVEVRVNPGLAAAPENADAKVVMENINGFLGIGGDSIKDAPFSREFLPQLKMGIADSYEPLQTIQDMIGWGVRLPIMAAGAQTLAAKKPDQLIADLEALIADKKTTAQDIETRKIPMEELISSFNQVLDRPEYKRAWYQRFESQMTFNLQVLANAWRIFWAWEKANSELDIARPAGGNTSGGQNTSNRGRSRNGGVASAPSGTRTTGKNLARARANQLDPNRVEIEEVVGDEVEEISRSFHDSGNKVYEIIDDNIHVERSPSVEVRAGGSGPEGNSPPGMGSGVSEFFGDMPEQVRQEDDLPYLTFDMIAATIDELVPPDNTMGSYGNNNP